MSGNLFGLVSPALNRDSIEQTLQGLGQWGFRPDGTMKGNGYFGTLLRKDGDVSTELSAGFDINGRQVEAPLLVPTLNVPEIDHLLNGQGGIPDSILQKAYEYAMQRILAGKSPFAD
jgi:hypothetical protein